MLKSVIVRGQDLRTEYRKKLFTTGQKQLWSMDELGFVQRDKSTFPGLETLCESLNILIYLLKLHNIINNYKEKKNGPNIGLWGTPQDMGAVNR